MILTAVHKNGLTHTRARPKKGQAETRFESISLSAGPNLWLGERTFELAPVNRNVAVLKGL